MSKADIDNRANQLNPNNDAYYQSRGFGERPNDDDSEGGGFDAYSASTSFETHPQQTEKDWHLGQISSRAIAAHAEKCRANPGLDLCDFLMRGQPNAVYKNMGHGTAVIIHVLGCKADSEDASAIRLLADAWRKLSDMQDSLSVFRIEFH